MYWYVVYLVSVCLCGEVAQMSSWHQNRPSVHCIQFHFSLQKVPQFILYAIFGAKKKEWHYFEVIFVIKVFLAGYSMWNVYQCSLRQGLLHGCCDQGLLSTLFICLLIYLLTNLLIHSVMNLPLLYSYVSFVVSLTFLNNLRDYS